MELLISNRQTYMFILPAGDSKLSQIRDSGYYLGDNVKQTNRRYK